MVEEPEKDILLLMKEFLTYENCFLVSPTSYDENMNLTYAGGKLPENDLKDQVLKLSGNTCVDATLGACMLFKTKEFIEIGSFDENFFLYFSDDDLCRRVNQKNKSSSINRRQTNPQIINVGMTIHTECRC